MTSTRRSTTSPSIRESLLLDTHTLLWFIADDSSLSAAARTAIEDAADDVFVSVASASGYRELA
jgi:PIN domain nuclease of toxin-antitoxin system